MNSKTPELIVTTGPLAGSRFAVPEQGLRLGRSSTCEISIQDPALSRNHCLFEMRDGALWVTDLASANGTAVNGEDLGDASRRLVSGDIINAGESELRVEGGAPASDADPQQAGQVPAPEDMPTLDLGLSSSNDDDDGSSRKGVLARLVLWGVALAAVGVAAWLILGTPKGDEEPTPRAAAVDETLHSLSLERVRADAEGIFRYAVTLDRDGTLAVELDDTQGNRRVRKSAPLNDAAKGELAKVVCAKSVLELEPSYVADAARPNELKSVRLRMVVGAKVFETYVENEPEPEALKEAVSRLEAFSMGQLGILGVSLSRAELESRAAEARSVGDAKWDERDVQFGNMAKALAAYDEAVYYLETVNPKPADYDSLLERRSMVKAELARRYDDQRVAAERAISLENWADAQRELRILCELVPDAKDPRHDEANSKLLDVEARLKKNKKKGGR